VLVLSRKSGQVLVLGGEITITVLEVQGKRVRLGVEALGHVGVLRAELSPSSPRGGAPPGREAAGGHAAGG
jgi:carbon storage regulator